MKFILLCIFCFMAFIIMTYGKSFIDSIKNAEYLRVQSNIQKIVVLQDAYYAKHQTYIAVEPYPQDPVGEMAWWRSKETEGFTTLGWKPWGLPVSCRYGINATPQAYTIEMVCQSVDNNIYLGYVKPAAGMQEGLHGVFGQCSGKGVYKTTNSGTKYLLETIGPCNSESESFFDWLQERNSRKK